MTNMIEELYYGRLDPQMRDITRSDPIKKVSVDINKLEDELTERLQGEDKKLFIDFVNVYSELMGESNLESFITGFRYGARMILDTFCSDSARFESY